MSYYWFNRHEIFEKQKKDRYSKKKLLSIIHKTKKQ